MKAVRFFIFFTVVLTASCQSEQAEKPLEGKTAAEKPKSPVVEKKAIPDFLVNQNDTLVKVNAFNSAIFWELKYATSDNFMHRVLYDTLQAVYIQKDISKRLAKCQELLSRINPDLHLLIYDGVRPQSVQQEMWDALDTIPVGERGKFVSNPKNGSVHNYGAAVDLTICDKNRKPLDMGAGYDDIRKIAYPSLENEFLASGELTKEHIENRELLRKVMRSQQFNNIPTEWWHFNAYYRRIVKGRYAIVRFEL